MERSLQDAEGVEEDNQQAWDDHHAHAELEDAAAFPAGSRAVNLGAELFKPDDRDHQNRGEDGAKRHDDIVRNEVRGVQDVHSLVAFDEGQRMDAGENAVAENRDDAQHDDFSEAVHTKTLVLMVFGTPMLLIPTLTISMP